MTESEEEKKPDEETGALDCGRQLRRTREKVGLTLDDVAAELRLGIFQIQALEDDDWTKLPGTTYARGYLRSYARLLGLDADQLMAGASTQEIEISRKEPEIEARKTEALKTEAPEPDEEAEPASGPSRARTWIGAGALGVLVVLSAAFWQYREGGELLPDLTDPGATAQRDPAADEQMNVEPLEPEPETTQAATYYEEMDEGPPPMPTVPDKAVFEFAGDSWIDVRDARGERLLYRDFPAGRRVEVEGRPPFQVYLGNANAVQVEYMGDVVEPDTGSGRMYARFVLGAPSG
ncbi:MAG: DUF4115 domain-containing protein [Gammaproteobacteria bacterium]|nr:DUF4115 domain-containing protein [Gammaproteobacteria bacterium]